MLTLKKIMALVFLITGISLLSNPLFAATFSCSAGDASPEAGLCYNALETEGDPSGDFRTSTTWGTDFGFVLTVTSGFSASQFGTKDGSGKAVSSQNASNVENVLEGVDWFNQSLTYVDQVDSIDQSTYASTILANVFYIHAGSTVMAFFYDTAISNFSITSQGFGLSNLRAFNSVTVVPLPAALPLYGAGLVVLGLIGWKRRFRK